MNWIRRLVQGAKRENLLTDPEPKGRMPAKPVELHQTIADEIDYVCEQLNATYDRSVLMGGGIRLHLHLEGGDTIAGTGETTREAWAALRQKLGGLP